MGPGVRRATLKLEFWDFALSEPAPEQASVNKTLMWRLVDKNARIRFIVLSSEYTTSGWRSVDNCPAAPSLAVQVGSPPTVASHSYMMSLEWRLTVFESRQDKLQKPL